MTALLWRMLYVVLLFVVLGFVLPLFLQIIGLDVPANVVTLIRIIAACIAVIYVIWGKTPPAPVP